MDGEGNDYLTFQVEDLGFGVKHGLGHPNQGALGTRDMTTLNQLNPDTFTLVTFGHVILSNCNFCTNMGDNKG